MMILIQLLQAIRESDLEGDLFKARSEFMPDFRSALHDNLSINLTVFFPHTENLAANDADALFDHAMFGNYIECAHTEKPGEVYMRFADPAKLYTMVMVCPDHPSRVNPDGHLVHWMVYVILCIVHCVAHLLVISMTAIVVSQSHTQTSL